MSAPGDRSTSAVYDRSGGAGKVRLSNRRPRNRIEHRGGVAHAARHAELADQTREHVAVVGGEGDSPPARLQAHEPAARRRDADRAARVVSVRHRHHPGRDRSRCAATRPPGSPFGIPGIAGRTEQPRFRGRSDGELRGVRLAHEHQPGGAEPAHQLAVLGRHMSAQKGARLGETHALDLGEEVLHEERDPGEDTGPECGRVSARGLARVVVHPGHNRVDESRSPARLDRLRPPRVPTGSVPRPAPAPRNVSRRARRVRFVSPSSAHPPSCESFQSRIQRIDRRHTRPSTAVAMTVPARRRRAAGAPRWAGRRPDTCARISRRCTSSTCPSS